MEAPKLYHQGQSEWFVRGNIPSSKNSKTAVPGKGVFHSKTVKTWLMLQGVQAYSVGHKTVKGYKTRPNLFARALQGFKLPEEKPAIVGVHLVRDTKRRYDFHNIVQVLADLLVAHNIIEDDDTTVVYFVPYLRNGNWQTIDKNRPGAYLTILQP